MLYMCVLMNAIHVCFDECYTCVLYMCVSMNAVHVCFDEDPFIYQSEEENKKA